MEIEEWRIEESQHNRLKINVNEYEKKLCHSQEIYLNP